MDWVGTCLLLLGSWLVGRKLKEGFLFELAGELAWIAWAVANRQWSILVVAAVFSVVLVKNYIDWLRGEQ